LTSSGVEYTGQEIGQRSYWYIYGTKTSQEWVGTQMESEVNYKGQNLPLNFQEFREDLERVWKVLIEKYMQEQNKKIDELINTLRTKG
jgi:hypothetical protein